MRNPKRLPDAPIMAVAAPIALVADLARFFLLMRFRDQDINLRSVWLCSRNDVFSNAGMIAAAGAVAWLGQGWPDLLVAIALLAQCDLVARAAMYALISSSSAALGILTPLPEALACCWMCWRIRAVTSAHSVAVCREGAGGE